MAYSKMKLLHIILVDSTVKVKIIALSTKSVVKLPTNFQPLKLLLKTILIVFQEKRIHGITAVVLDINGVTLE